MAGNLVFRLPGLQGANSDPWEAVKRRCALAVVLIEMEIPRSFGDAKVGNGIATGYVVDSRMGIILTNKHVVGDGPIRAKATFMNNQKVDLDPIYRDPIHDFGFFRFDPAQIKDFTLQEIRLDPAGARPQVKTLVMGNNGQGVSFLESTIAKVDADYVPGIECNTFYIMATDTAVTGNSGGPLLDINGNAIGIVHAGNSNRNLSFYLPLHRIQYALQLFQKGERIPRGTLQVAFRYVSYQDIGDRGANKVAVVAHRKANSVSAGMLVASKTLPKGPGFLGGIKNGDILLKINEKYVDGYNTLSVLLDEFAGKSVKVEILRGEQEVVLEQVAVQDMEEIELNELVEVSDGIFTAMGYSKALSYGLPIEGVVVTQPGYMFSAIGREKVIVGIGDYPVTDLASFREALTKYKNGTVVGVKYFSPFEPSKPLIDGITIDTRWSPFRHGKRQASNGAWTYEDCIEKAKTSDQIIVADADKVPKEPLVKKGADRKELGDSIVFIYHKSPLPLSKVDVRAGVGVIVDVQLGLVVCSPDVIPSTFGDVFIHFGTVLKVRANVLYIHPRIDFVILQFDPKKVEEDPVAEVFAMKLSSKRSSVGDKLKFIGARGAQDLVFGEGFITDLAVDMRVDGVKAPGVYYDEEDQEIRGVMLGNGTCTPSYSIQPHLAEIRDAIRSGKPTPKSIKTLGISLGGQMVTTARDVLKLSNEWVLKLKKKSDNSNRMTLLKVSRRMVGSDAYEHFNDNDIILAIDGEPVSIFLNYLDLIAGKDQVDVTVLRNREVQELKGVKMTTMSTVGVDRIVTFGGMIVHKPDPGLYYLSTPEYFIDSGVFVSSIYFGSPAVKGEGGQGQEQNGKVGKLIDKINGQKIKGLDQLLDIITKIKSGEFVRISTVNITNGSTGEHTVRLDLEYWPTRDFVMDSVHGWNYEIIEHAS